MRCSLPPPQPLSAPSPRVKCGAGKACPPPPPPPLLARSNGVLLGTVHVTFCSGTPSRWRCSCRIPVWSSLLIRYLLALRELSFAVFSTVPACCYWCCAAVGAVAGALELCQASALCKPGGCIPLGSLCTMVPSNRATQRPRTTLCTLPSRLNCLGEPISSFRTLFSQTSRHLPKWVPRG